MRVEKDFEDFFRIINKHGVKYFVIGSFALAFHAIPRYTKDIDILVEHSGKNAEKIVRAIEEFGFRCIGLTREDFEKEGTIVYLGKEPVRIDVLTSADGCDFGKAWKNRNTASYGGERINVVGISDLIRMKRAANRKQDIADLEVLMKAKGRRRKRA